MNLGDELHHEMLQVEHRQKLETLELRMVHELRWAEFWRKHDLPHYAIGHEIRVNNLRNEIKRIMDQAVNYVDSSPGPGLDGRSVRSQGSGHSEDQ